MWQSLLKGHRVKTVYIHVFKYISDFIQKNMRKNLQKQLKVTMHLCDYCFSKQKSPHLKYQNITWILHMQQ